MADSKISSLTAVAAVVGTHEFPVNEAGSSKKASADQIVAYALSVFAGKRTKWVPVSDMAPATTNGPSSATLEAASNKQNYKVLDFDATTRENAHFQIAFEKEWNESTVSAQFFWSSTATDTDGVTWGIEAYAVSDNEAIDAVWGTAQVIDDACQSAAGEVYVSAETPALTIGGTPAEGDLVFFRVYRDVGDSNDVATEDARLIGIKLIFTVNALESD